MSYTGTNLVTAGDSSIMSGLKALEDKASTENVGHWPRGL